MTPDGDRIDFSKETPSPENLLSAIVESSDDAIISKDLNNTVTSWNRSAERMFGYSAVEILGRSITILVPPDRIHEVEDFLKEIKSGDRVNHFETVRLRKDGREIDVSVSVSPVYSASGRFVGASEVARDISETKRASVVDLLLASIVSSSDDAIISKNLDGIITSWNAGAERIFGYRAEEIIGQSVLKLIPPERKDEEPKILERLHRGERVDHFETIRIRKNGETFSVSLTISPVRNQYGKIVGASKIARDISDLKGIAREREALLESERIARAQAEHANRLKDEFLATVSHELRTPLNAIVGWADVLAESGQGGDEVAHGIAVIRKNAMMQAQLIEDLLDLGRITSGKLVLNVESMDLKSVVTEALASVQHAADVKRISVNPHLEDIDHAIMGDPKRLQQVVWNLLSNAIKFTEEGGRVVVALAQIGSNIMITVSDNGRGISPQFLPQLFERFRQSDASTSRRHGGLGIGLALVKQLVDLHGGKVRAESGGLGLGATFIVTLPASAVTERAGRSADKTQNVNAVSAELSGLKVLAVDDDGDSVDVVKRILTGRGAEVRTACSMAAATEILRTYTPDVILSDIGMPQNDGYEFIRQLREHAFFAGIPAVALTALARPEDRTRALNAGFQSHIAKPLAAAELVAVVGSLGKLRFAREAAAANQSCARLR